MTQGDLLRYVAEALEALGIEYMIGGSQASKYNIFTAEHEMLRKTVRAFVEKEVTPRVQAWEEAGRIPREFWRRMGQLGLLGLDFPVEYGRYRLHSGALNLGRARRLRRISYHFAHH